MNRTGGLLAALSIFGSVAWASAQEFTQTERLFQLAQAYGLAAAFERQQAEMLASNWGFATHTSGRDLMAIRNGRPIFYTVQGVEAADTVSADEVWPGGSAGLSLSGSGVTLGIWDNGLAQPNHPELTGRVTSGDGVNSVADHATAVGGVMIAAGVDPLYRGFSFGGSLTSFDYNSDHSEMATGAAGGLRVSNHSYGNAAGWFFNLRGDGKWVWLGDPAISPAQDYRFGFYGSDAAALDEIVYNAPNLFVSQAVGNERNNGPTTQPVEHWEYVSNNWTLTSAARDLDGSGTGYDTLMEQACAKNIVTVGPVDFIVGGWTVGASARSLSTASWGPTDDGRVKPDIVACGGSVRTLSAGSGYQTFGGSSLAAPNVSGAAGLLIEHYRNTHANANMKAATLKALMIHTADDAGTAGPDYSFGWGLMNVKTAAQVISDDAAYSTTITELTLAQGNEVTFTVLCDGTEPLKVTTAWTDPAGPVSAIANNPATLRLINDLDLRVEFGANTFRPFVLNSSNPSAAATRGVNSRDNVEQVLIPNPAPGQYTIRINHQGSLLQPSGTQAFSLITSGFAKVNLSSVGVNPGAVIGGTNAVGTVTLDGVAPTGGRVVALSDNSNLVTVPSSVQVLAGANSATFPVTTIGTGVDSVATITASLNGLSTTTTLTVQRFTLSSVRLVPTAVYGGYASTGTVTLSGPAGTSGASVLLSSSNPSAATVPSSVVVPSSLSTASFTVTTQPVAANVIVTITGTRAGITKSYPISIKAPILASMTVSPNIQAGSLSVTARVNINTNAPANYTVAIASSSPKATPPVSVTVPQGAKFVTFPVPTGTVTGQVAVLLSCTRSSITKQASLLLYPTTLHALSLAPTSVVGGATSTGTVTLSLNAISNTAVLLSSSNTAVATVPASTTVAAGTKTKTFVVTTLAVASQQVVTITANRNNVFRTASLTVRP